MSKSNRNEDHENWENWSWVEAWDGEQDGKGNTNGGREGQLGVGCWKMMKCCV